MQKKTYNLNLKELLFETEKNLYFKIIWAQPMEERFFIQQSLLDFVITN